MASKNLLPVVALCGALATGTPVAAWATPVMADSLPASPKLRTKSVERHCVPSVFRSHRPRSRTSGCLRRNTDGSIVVDIKRSNKAERLPGGVRRLHVALGCSSMQMAIHAI